MRIASCAKTLRSVLLKFEFAHRCTPIILSVFQCGHSPIENVGREPQVSTDGWDHSVRHDGYYDRLFCAGSLYLPSRHHRFSGHSRRPATRDSCPKQSNPTFAGRVDTCTVHSKPLEVFVAYESDSPASHWDYRGSHRSGRAGTNEAPPNIYLLPREFSTSRNPRDYLV